MSILRNVIFIAILLSGLFIFSPSFAHGGHGHGGHGHGGHAHYHGHGHGWGHGYGHRGYYGRHGYWNNGYYGRGGWYGTGWGPGLYGVSGCKTVCYTPGHCKRYCKWW